MTIQTATARKVHSFPSDAQVMGTTAEALPVIVKGIASRVVLDRKRGTATKVYRKHFLVRLLYWLSFQAPFPYLSNIAALKAAQYRRRIAGLITKFFLGRDVVAPTLEVRPEGDGYAFVTEYVSGTSPRDRKQARAFLGRVTEAFIQSGLPTWQVTPNNPRAVGNLIETENGDYRIIDLESNVVTPMMPLSGLWGAAREAHLPAFDDIDVPRLRSFVCEHRTELKTTLGEKDFRALQKAINRYAWYERRWHESEPRLWGRIARFAARAVDVPAHIRRLRARAGGGQEMAEGFIRRGIDDWQQEKHLTAQQASALRDALSTPEVATVMVHFGAHMAISVPLRFPLGSIARALWTLTFRARLEWSVFCGKAEQRSARAIHSLPVALFAALPGVGGFAYLLTKPLRRHRALVVIAFDRMLRKIPFRVYQRLHLSALMTWLAASGQKQPRTARDWGWLKPSRLAGTAKSGLASLRPYRGMIIGVMAFNAAAVVAGGAYLAVTGSLSAFAEYGPITTLKVMESLAAGALGVLIYRRFWSQPGAEGRPGAAGSFFWLVAGLGLGWLAVDDYLQIHERVGAALLGSSVPLLNNVDDVIVLGYGVLALATIALFYREIMSSRPVVTLLVAGVSFGLLMLTVDFFVPEGLFVAGLEDPAHVSAVGLVLAAFAVKYRQVGVKAQAADERLVAEGPAPARELSFAMSQERREVVPAAELATARCAECVS